MGRDIDPDEYEYERPTDLDEALKTVGDLPTVKDAEEVAFGRLAEAAGVADEYIRDVIVRELSAMLQRTLSREEVDDVMEWVQSSLPSVGWSIVSRRDGV